MVLTYKEFILRDWQLGDRQAAATLIEQVLAEYGLGWEPTGTDRDAVAVETYYQQAGGEFWVVEQAGIIVGTGGYYPVLRGDRAVEIRKMYLQPAVRGCGLGSFLLAQLEGAIAARGYRTIWIETASVLAAAVRLYENRGYQAAAGGETPRCDRLYVKYLSP